MLYERAGLLGLSSISDDVRVLQEITDPCVIAAVEYFASAMTKYAGAYAAVLGGQDAFVFTAGIGEHSWKVREAALKDMEWMGVLFDAEANRANAQIISAKDSPTIVFVIPTNEELMIAEHTASTAGVGKVKQ